MLHNLVERICAEIDRLPLVPGGPELAEQIRAAAPDAIEQTISGNQKQRKKLSSDDAAKTLALVALLFIKGIPRTARAMVEKVKDRKVNAARRCAIASLLAYLVQPHDIIPDDAPGHYGYLDDAILLNAGLVEYLDTLPGGITNADSMARMASVSIGLTPPEVRLVLQSVVSSMSQLVQILSIGGPEITEGTLAQIVANPLQFSAVTAPPGFSPRPARDYGGGHWSGGSYFEGNNVIMGGGGPALIDGQLFIPG